MNNKIITFLTIYICLIGNVYSLTSDEENSIKYLKSKGQGIYDIENYEKEKRLEIDNNAIIRNEELSKLIALKDLEYLFIEKKTINDEGVKFIGYLKKLKCLGLRKTQLTDRGMEYIGQLENLEELNISDTQVTDEGLKHLRNLKKLEELVLDNTNITGEGFQYINELPNLRVLVVSPKLKGENLRYLGKMKLELLNIAENAIDDRAIPYLTKLKTLERLIIFDTKISKEGVKQLEKALPQCMVYDERGGGEDG